jgi:hypothetical protein
MNEVALAALRTRTSVKVRDACIARVSDLVAQLAVLNFEGFFEVGLCESRCACVSGFMLACKADSHHGGASFFHISRNIETTITDESCSCTHVAHKTHCFLFIEREVFRFTSSHSSPVYRKLLRPML